MTNEPAEIAHSMSLSGTHEGSGTQPARAATSLRRGWILWLAAVLGQAFSTLLGYSLIGLARLFDPGAFHQLVSAPDYGVSAISAAWLGAIAAVGWRTRRQSIGRAAIVLGCVAIACLAWFVRGKGLDLLDSEHAFAFAIGVGVAVGRALAEPLQLPQLLMTRPMIRPVTRASRSSGGQI